MNRPKYNLKQFRLNIQGIVDEFLNALEDESQRAAVLGLPAHVIILICQKEINVFAEQSQIATNQMLAKLKKQKGGEMNEN